VQKVPTSRMFMVPNAYHEILYETELVRQAALKVVYDFFSQRSDDVHQV
jgi:alpha-beta hydrolase superfamily lysophospholipase